MNKFFKALLFSSLSITTILNVSHAGLWDDVKSVAVKAGDAVVDTAGKVGDTASDLVNDETSYAHQRQEINNNAQKALSRLFKESKELKGALQEWNAAGNGVVDIVNALNEKAKKGESRR